MTSLLSSRPRRLRGGRVGTCLHGLAAKTRKAAGETRWHCRPPPHGEAARAPSTPLPRGAPPAARRGSASRAADARSLCRSLKQSLRLSVAPRSRRRSPAVLRRGAATLCREARFRGGVGGARAPGCSSALRGLREGSAPAVKRGPGRLAPLVPGRQRPSGAWPGSRLVLSAVSVCVARRGRLREGVGDAPLPRQALGRRRCSLDLVC